MAILESNLNANGHDLQAQLDALRAENAALRQAKAQSGTFVLKVSEKGALSVYGMGRWPVTLYREQWAKLLAHKADIEAFINANANQLKTKGVD